MKKTNIWPFCGTAVLFLRLALPYLVVVSVAILVTFLQQRALDPVTATFLCRPWLEYLISGIVIMTGGTCLLDYIERSAKR